MSKCDICGGLRGTCEPGTKWPDGDDCGYRIKDQADRIEALEAERDALRARVAELEQVLDFALGCLEGADTDWSAHAERVLSRAPAQSLAEIKAGALERWASKAEVEYYTATGSVTEWPEVIGDAKRESARIRAGGEG